MANKKTYKAKVNKSGEEIDVYKISSGKDEGKFCNYNDCKTLYNKNEITLLDNGR